MSNGQKIIQVNIEEEMKTAYIDYSMSVIVARAIPDARDGLKPVHRRVLFAMNELGLAFNRAHKKSARVVGEVLGKYHPHGDASVYDTMVRMVQPWSLRYPLIDGQGNFGSMDNDPPAAMRYTEVRLQRIAEEIMADIDKDTVDFQLNFDDTLKEPIVMPSRLPNLLVNGSSGIAVGMATNILPHNLSEVIDGICAYIDNKDITVEELIKFVKAPDFPTGGIIYGYDGVRQGLLTGKGKVVVRARTVIEQLKNGKERIIVNEFPYQVNKALVHAKISELAAEKVIDGVADCRDESDRDGVRLVIELKRDAIPNVVLNQLFNFTLLQNSYGVNNIALVAGRPKLMSLRDMIQVFVEFRHEVVIRRTKFELAEAERRAHILEGLLIAIDHLDEVIALIRGSKTPEEAQSGLINQFKLSEIQAKAILDMRFAASHWTGARQDPQRVQGSDEAEEFYKDLLSDEKLRFEVIKDEMLEMKKKYGDERRTEIVYSAEDMNIED
jgi:DNA gyrase subunit A